MMAIRPDGLGDVTATHVAWRYKKGLPNVPSPVLAGGLMFLVADTGIATCLDAKTGEMKWSERIPGSYTASPMVRGSTVYAFADDGRAVLFKAADVFEEVGRNQLDGRIQATPAAVDGSLIVRTDASLYRLTDLKDRKK